MNYIKIWKETPSWIRSAIVIGGVFLIFFSISLFIPVNKWIIIVVGIILGWIYLDESKLKIRF